VCDYTIIEPRYPCILMGVAKPHSRGMDLPHILSHFGQKIGQNHGTYFWATSPDGIPRTHGWQ